MSQASSASDLTKPWKQPITTGVYSFFDNDYNAMNLFIHIMLHARNEDMQEAKFYKKKPYLLKRGQSLFGKREYAKYLKCSASAARDILLRLQDRYGLLTIQPCDDFTIVTLKNYDQLVEMCPVSDRKVTDDKLQSVTNKSDKSVKTEKTTVSEKSELFNEILKEFTKHPKKYSINNPEAYLAKLYAEVKNDEQAIKRAWNEWRRGNGITSKGSFWERALYHHEKLTNQ